MLKLESIKKNAAIGGIEPGQVVRIVTTEPVGPDAVTVYYKTSDGRLQERMLFRADEAKHVVFGFHGYPSLVHRLTYRRANRNLHVHGYKEEGTITTPFDMRVQNELDRFHLVQDVVDCLPHLGSRGAYGQCLTATSTEDSPWYVVPADDKDSARLIVSRVILDAFEELNMSYPAVTPARKRELRDIRKTLEK